MLAGRNDTEAKLEKEMPIEPALTSWLARFNAPVYGRSRSRPSSGRRRSCALVARP
jgi:hypothetical protein